MNREASLKSMPPPERLYVPGSREFQVAIEKGILHVSRPSPMRRQEAPPRVLGGDCSPSSSSEDPILRSSSSSFYVDVAMKGSASEEGWNVSDARPSPTTVTSWTDPTRTIDEQHNQFIVQESHQSAGTNSSDVGRVEPSCLDEIIGHDEAKIRVQEVLLSLSPRFSAVMTGIRALPPSILLYGPPGCGKTKLARAIAGEARAAFLPVAPSDVMSKYVGESEGRVREIFSEAWNLAGQAESSCCVIFFDEIDALGHARGHGGGGEASGGAGGGGGGCSRRVIIELLLQLTLWSDQMKERRPVWTHQSSPSNNDAMDDDSLQNSGSDAPPNRIIVVAATNRFEDCDQALLRRFGIHLHVGLPTIRHRKMIVHSLLSDVSHVISPQDLHELALLTDGWSGSDLESLTREAAMAPVRECIRRANGVRRRLQSQAPRLPTHGESHPIAFSVVDYIESDVETLRPVAIQDFLRAVEFLSPSSVANNSVNANPSDEDD